MHSYSGTFTVGKPLKETQKGGQVMTFQVYMCTQDYTLETPAGKSRHIIQVCITVCSRGWFNYVLIRMAGYKAMPFEIMKSHRNSRTSP